MHVSHGRSGIKETTANTAQTVGYLDNYRLKFVVNQEDGGKAYADKTDMAKERSVGKC